MGMVLFTLDKYLRGELLSHRVILLTLRNHQIVVPFTFPPAFPRPHTLPCLPLCPRYLPPLAPVFLQSSLSVPRAPLKAQSPATCNPIPWHSLLFSNQSQDFIPSHCCAWTNLTPWILGLLPWTRPAVLSRVQFSVTPWTVAFQASLSMGFSRQEYWSGLAFLQGIFPTQGSHPCLLYCGWNHRGSPSHPLTPSNPNQTHHFIQMQNDFFLPSSKWKLSLKAHSVSGVKTDHLPPS